MSEPDIVERLMEGVSRVSKLAVVPNSLLREAAGIIEQLREQLRIDDHGDCDLECINQEAGHYLHCNRR